MDILEHLESKITDKGEFRDIALLISNNLASDVKPFFLQGLERIGKVVLAKPYTRYGWLLAIYHAIGKVEGDTLIIYYNAEDPRWTASTLIHEAIHIALDISHTDTLNALVDEALAYTASFKSGFHNLYLKGIRQAIELLSSCRNPYEEHELAGLVIPRILAHRLIEYDYTDLTEQATEEPRAIFRLWLETSPSEEEVQALAAALTVSGINPGIPALETPCKEAISTAEGTDTHSYEFEGVDKDFLEMIRLLNEAAKNRHKAYEILKPWWNELKEIKHELEAYLDVYTD